MGWHRYRKGKHWMVQFASWAGLLNFGVHVSLRGVHYIDIHLPYMVITLGNVSAVEYPPQWHAASRERATGVSYGTDE